MGLLGVVAGGLIRYISKRHKDARDNDSSLEEIRNEGVRELLADYRQQVVELRVEIRQLRSEMLEQATRHRAEMMEKERAFEALEVRHAEIQIKYDTLLVEITSKKKSDK